MLSNPLTDIDPYSPTGQSLIWFYYQLKGETPPPEAIVSNKPSFWEQLPGADSVKAFSESVKEFNNNTSEFFTNTNTFIRYITHPKMIWDLFYQNSFILAVIFCGLFLILWLMGYKKGIKYASWSVTIYMLSIFVNILFSVV